MAHDGLFLSLFFFFVNFCLENLKLFNSWVSYWNWKWQTMLALSSPWEDFQWFSWYYMLGIIMHSPPWVCHPTPHEWSSNCTPVLSVLLCIYIHDLLHFPGSSWMSQVFAICCWMNWSCDAWWLVMRLHCISDSEWCEMSWLMRLRRERESLVNSSKKLTKLRNFLAEGMVWIVRVTLTLARCRKVHGRSENGAGDTVLQEGI